MTNYESCGEKLRAMREKLSLTQASIAKKLGLNSDRTVSNWEGGKGRPKLGNLIGLAKIFVGQEGCLETAQDVINWAVGWEHTEGQVSRHLQELARTAIIQKAPLGQRFQTSVRDYLSERIKQDVIDEPGLLKDFRQWLQDKYQQSRGDFSHDRYIVPRLISGHWAVREPQPNTTCYYPQDLVREKRLIILGPPGMGKTSLCRYLETEMLREDSEEAILPIFVDLAEYAPYADNQDLLTFVSDRDKRRGCPTDRLEVVLRSMHKVGRLFFLLDGWDAVASSTRKTLAHRAEEARYYVITSRGEIPSVPLKDNSVFTLAEFTDVDTYLYISNWEKWAKQRDVQFDAERLVDNLTRHPGLWALTRVPGYLATICQLVEREGIDHLRKWRVIEHIVDERLGQLPQILRERATLALARWAFYSYGGGRGYDPPKPPLAYSSWERCCGTTVNVGMTESMHWQMMSPAEMIEIYEHLCLSGLLLAPHSGVESATRFAHEAIHAYLAALYVLKRRNRESAGELYQLSQRADGRRIMRLTVGMLGVNDLQSATGLLGNQQQLALGLHSIFRGQCLAELDCAQAKEALRDGTLDRDLKELWDCYPSDALRQEIGRIGFWLELPGLTEALLRWVTGENGHGSNYWRKMEPEAGFQKTLEMITNERSKPENLPEELWRAVFRSLSIIGLPVAQKALGRIAEIWPVAELLRNSADTWQYRLVHELLEAIARLPSCESMELLAGWTRTRDLQLSDAAMHALVASQSLRAARYAVKTYLNSRGDQAGQWQAALARWGGPASTAVLTQELEMLVEVENRDLARIELVVTALEQIDGIQTRSLSEAQHLLNHVGPSNQKRHSSSQQGLDETRRAVDLSDTQIRRELETGSPLIWEAEPHVGYLCPLLNEIIIRQYDQNWRLFPESPTHPPRRSANIGILEAAEKNSHEFAIGANYWTRDLDLPPSYRLSKRDMFYFLAGLCNALVRFDIYMREYEENGYRLTALEGNPIHAEALLVGNKRQVPEQRAIKPQCEDCRQVMERLLKDRQEWRKAWALPY